MIEIPHGIQVFVLVGIALVVIAVPIRILYEMTKDTRDRARRVQDLADRLRERFGGVRVERSLLGLQRIHFQHEERAATIFLPSEDELEIQLDTRISPKFHVIARTRGSLTPPFVMAWESFVMLPRILTHDPLIDEATLLYASPPFAAYLRELALDGLPAEGKPTGLAESLVVLRKMNGVDRFEFRMSPSGGVRVAFRLRSEDLLFRTEELESAVHHAFQLYDLLVLG